MAPQDDETESAKPRPRIVRDASIRNLHGSTIHKRDKLHHLFRTGQANADRSDSKAAKRPKPSLPPTPWDKKPDEQ